MNTMSKMIVTGLLTMVFIWGGEATNAYTPDEGNKTLVDLPSDNAMIAFETENHSYNK